MLSFKTIELLVLQKKILNGLYMYHILAWQRHLGHVYKLSFPLAEEAPHESGCDLPSGFREDG